MSEVMECPKCQAKLPFVCYVCGKEVGGLQLIGSSYPFSKEGLPLCSEHARSLCDKCHQPFAKTELTLRVLRWEHTSTGIEFPINGGFCPTCNTQHHDPLKAGKRSGCLGIFLFLNTY